MFSFLNMTINFQFWIQQKKLQSLVETFKVRLLYYAESKIVTLIILAFIYNILPRFIIHTCTSLYCYANGLVYVARARKFFANKIKFDHYCIMRLNNFVHL